MCVIISKLTTTDDAEILSLYDDSVIYKIIIISHVAILYTQLWPHSITWFAICLSVYHILFNIFT